MEVLGALSVDDIDISQWVVAEDALPLSPVSPHGGSPADALQQNGGKPAILSKSQQQAPAGLVSPQAVRAAQHRRPDLSDNGDDTTSWQHAVPSPFHRVTAASVLKARRAALVRCHHRRQLRRALAAVRAHGDKRHASAQVLQRSGRRLVAQFRAIRYMMAVARRQQQAEQEAAACRQAELQAAARRQAELQAAARRQAELQAAARRQAELQANVKPESAPSACSQRRRRVKFRARRKRRGGAKPSSTAAPTKPPPAPTLPPAAPTMPPAAPTWPPAAPTLPPPAPAFQPTQDATARRAGKRVRSTSGHDERKARVDDVEDELVCEESKAKTAFDAPSFYYCRHPRQCEAPEDLESKHPGNHHSDGAPGTATASTASTSQPEKSTKTKAKRKTKLRRVKSAFSKLFRRKKKKNQAQAQDDAGAIRRSHSSPVPRTKTRASVSYGEQNVNAGMECIAALQSHGVSPASACRATELFFVTDAVKLDFHVTPTMTKQDVVCQLEALYETIGAAS